MTFQNTWMAYFKGQLQHQLGDHTQLCQAGVVFFRICFSIQFKKLFSQSQNTLVWEQRYETWVSSFIIASNSLKNFCSSILHNNDSAQVPEEEIIPQGYKTNLIPHQKLRSHYFMFLLLKGKHSQKRWSLSLN